MEAEYVYDFLLIGIVSREKVHRLVWLLNQTLGYQFVHAGEMELYEQGQVTAGFVKYEYADEMNHLEIILFENKDGSVYLIPEMRTVDYFMMFKGSYDYVDVKALITSIQPIQEIQLITEIDHQKLKSKQNLIF